MKKFVLVTLGVVFFSFIAFAKINDNMKLFNENEIKKIDEKIAEIKERSGVDFYVNTLEKGEDFITENAEKIVMFNIKKIDDKKIGIDVKISKDIELKEELENIDSILDNNKEIVLEKNYGEYTLNCLNEIDNILVDNTVEEILLEKDTQNLPLEEKKNEFFKGIGIVIFLICAIIVRVIVKKNKNKNKKEENQK